MDSNSKKRPFAQLLMKEPPHTYLLIFVILIICAVLTYIVPAGNPINPPSTENISITTKITNFSLPAKDITSLLVNMSMVFVSLMTANDPPAIITKNISEAIETRPLGIALKN